MAQLRSTPEELARETATVSKSSMIPMLVETFPTYMAILNKRRQIVYSNEKAWKTKGFRNFEAIMGLRPGESLSCINSTSGCDGCGSSEACEFCGANKAIVRAIKTKTKQVEECIIATKTGGRFESYNFNITVTPIAVKKRHFYVLTAEDISNSKRRRNLERIFFHDLLNQVTTLQMALNLVLEEKETELANRLEKELPTIVSGIMDNILEQRSILAAENGELNLEASSIDTKDLLSGLCLSMSTLNSQVLVGISTSSTFGILTSDLSFVQRVLINLLKNAIEASNDGDTVTIEVKHHDAQVIFRVNNPAVMPKEIKNKIFQRSFSTKHPDRGLGTYSAKLLTENYLHGTIWFTSEEGAGTTFVVELPENIPNNTDFR